MLCARRRHWEAEERKQEIGRVIEDERKRSVWFELIEINSQQWLMLRQRQQTGSQIIPNGVAL